MEDALTTPRRLACWKAKPGAVWAFEVGPFRIHKAHWTGPVSEGWEVSVYFMGFARV